jgi:excisionase family DNA binding protein
METVQDTKTVQDNNPANLAYTIPEAAIKLRMSDKSVRRQIDKGRLRRCKGYGRVLIPRKDVDTFFEKHSDYSFSA